MAVMWSYNGIELPALPDVMDEYPYAFIHETGGLYTLVLTSTQLYGVPDNTGGCTRTMHFAGTSASACHYSFYGNLTDWKHGTSIKMASGVSYATPQIVSGIIWSNYDIYRATADEKAPTDELYFAGSDPTGPDIDMSGSSIAIHCHTSAVIGEMLGITVSLTVPEGYDNSYTLEVQGAESENTRIEETDVENVYHLYIGADETSTMVLLRATSRQFPQLKATKGVQVVGNATITGIEIITASDTIETGSLRNIMAKVRGENGVVVSAFTASLSGNNSAESQVIRNDSTVHFSLFCGWAETADELTVTVTSTQDPTASASKKFTVVKPGEGGDSGGSGGGSSSGGGDSGGSEGGDSGGTGGGDDSGDDSGGTGTDTADSYKKGFMAGLSTGLALYSCK